MRGHRLSVLLEVEKGPATSRDIADALGIKFPIAAAVLSYLHGEGLLTRQELPRQGRGKNEAVYSIATPSDNRRTPPGEGGRRKA